MPDRIVPQSQLGREDIRPVASPVDTFVKPERSSLLDLAESLGRFSQGAASVAQAVSEATRAKQQEQGAQAGSQAAVGGKSYRQALADGDINPAGSSTYKSAAKRQYAQLAAYTYGGALNSFMQNDLAGETDLDSFHKKVDEFTAQWTKDNLDPEDGELLRLWSTASAPIRANNIAQQEGGVGERLRAQTEERFSTLVGLAVTGEHDWTDPEGRDARIATAAATLRQQAYDMGIRGSRVNELIFEGVNSMAYREGKPELLEAIAAMPTGQDGTGGRLDAIPAYAEKIARGINAAEAQANRLEVGSARDRKANTDRILADMQDALLKLPPNVDPSTFDIRPFQVRMNDPETGDPTRVRELEQARQSMILGHTRTVVRAVAANALDRVYSPDAPLTEREAWQMHHDGGMDNATFTSVMRQIQARDRSNKRPGLNPYALMTEGRSILRNTIDAANLDPSVKATNLAPLLTELSKQMYAWLDSPEGQAADIERIRAHSRSIAEALGAQYHTPRKPITP